MKTCAKCGVEKPLEEFSTRSRLKSGKASRCKVCASIININWRLKNPDRVKNNNQKWYSENKEKAIENSYRWQKTNPEKRVKIQRQQHLRNLDNIRERKQRYMLIPKNRLNSNMKSLIGLSLKPGVKAGRRWESLVGYTVMELKEHLEKQFQPGMSWEERNKWHLDHKKPVAAFNFQSPEDKEFKQCWALENLQPLWAKENESKGARY
jgi:hypothetical protein